MLTGYLNYYMSALRNMFLTSSIAVAMVGFSDRFGNKSFPNKLLVKIIAFFTIILSIVFGMKATEDFKTMLRTGRSSSSFFINQRKANPCNITI